MIIRKGDEDNKITIFLIVASLFFVSGCSNQEKPVKTNKGTNKIVIYNGLDKPENQRTLDFVEFLKTEKGITLVNEEWKLSSTPVTELNGLLKIHGRFLLLSQIPRRQV